MNTERSIMNKKERILFTSESVSEGHPDKVCDQIADAILDAAIKDDPACRCACEVLATENQLVLAGEITTKNKVDYEKIARDVIKDIGYDKDEYGFNYSTVKIANFIHTQSPDIAQGVNRADGDFGAGDQGIMFGFASNESDNYMPLAIVIAHKLVRVASNLRKEGKLNHARPDMKSQVTIDYTDKEDIKIDTIVFSCQHDDNIDLEAFKNELIEKVINPVVSSFNFPLTYKLFINPTGKFVIGGPKGDTGVTGRKIIVDTYGGYAPHGGGAFSGKDPTKVDRSAAYYARYAAKNIVASKLCDKCLIQLSYAIGYSKPISINVNTFGTNKVSEDVILEVLYNVFDFSPRNIIESLSLFKPTFEYHKLTNYGHFGRPDLNLPFEKLDKVEEILKFVNNQK